MRANLHSSIFDGDMQRDVVDLSSYSHGSFFHGKSYLIRFIWILFSRVFFDSHIPYPSKLKSNLLRLFGAKVGQGLVIRPCVRIKQPWCLTIGDNVWVGEFVRIDNLVQIHLGSNVCLSQGSFLLTGNHDYSRSSFDLITGEIQLDDGVWIGANALVGPGVTCHSHAVLVAGSMAFNDLEAYQIYQGNPARIKRRRVFK